MKDKKLEPAFAKFESNYTLEGGHHFLNIVLKPYEKSFA